MTPKSKIGLSVTLFLLLGAVISHCTPGHLLSPPGVNPPVYGHLYIPSSPGPHPCVILLHGRYGIHPDQDALARRLSQEGFACLLHSYYQGLGEEGYARSPKLRSAVLAAVNYARSLPRVAQDRIGLVGFSQGAFLAVSVSALSPAVKAVVAYSGGAPRDLDDYAHRVPPTLILHGGQDKVTPPKGAFDLYHDLRLKGIPAKIHIYPKAKHNFNLRGPFYEPKAASDALQETLRFLAEHLHP